MRIKFQTKSANDDRMSTDANGEQYVVDGGVCTVKPFVTAYDR